MLDLIDPNRFILIRDDFLRFFLIEDSTPNLSRFIKENKKLIAQPIFDIESNQTIFKEPKDKIRQKNEVKTIRNFKHLTIMHLILFCCQQFSSHNQKIRKTKLQKITEYYSKMIPEYKTKEGYNLELITSSLFDQKNENIINLYEKNISRNTANKSLLNSFFNIIDEGLNTNYLRDFIPMVKAIKQKIEESNNTQQGQEKEKLINLRKYLLPKIEIKSFSNTNFTMLNMYKDIYLNLEDKYMKHLSDVIHYENYHISPEMQSRVDDFNKVVVMKKKLLEKYMKVRYVVDEETFNQLIQCLFNDIEILKRELIEKAEREEEEKKQQIKEENEKENNSSDNNSDSMSMKGDDDTKSKKDTKEKLHPNKINYRAILNIKKEEYKNEETKELLKLKKVKEDNSLPSIDVFLNSIIIYILPNNPKNMLSNYIGRHDYIYKSLISKLGNGINRNVAEGKYNLHLLTLYLTEAKHVLELNIYTAQFLDSNKNQLYPLYYFYSIFELDVSTAAGFDLALYDKNEEKIELTTELAKIRKIMIINISPDSRDNVKYISKENSELLDVYLIKIEKFSGENNNKLFDKIVNFQSVTDNYKVSGLEINGRFRRISIDLNLPSNKYDFDESKINQIKIGRATYTDNNKNQYNFKARVATFAKI